MLIFFFNDLKKKNLNQALEQLHTDRQSHIAACISV